MSMSLHLDACAITHYTLNNQTQLPEDVLIILGHVEDLDGDELLEVSDGGQGGHSDKLSTQLRQLFWV